MSKWLENLAVGDTVVVLSSGLGGDFISKVERLTPTQIIIKQGGKFRRADGDRVGGSTGFHSPVLVEPTQEVTDRIRHDVLAKRLKRFDWNFVTLDKLREIADLLVTEALKLD